jgi:hypothetical protein
MANPENDDDEEVPDEDQIDNVEEFYPNQFAGLQEESDDDF